MKSSFYIKLLVLIIFSSCQSSQYFSPKQIAAKGDKIFPELVQLRRDIHKHPELSGMEERTSIIVASYLNNLGLEVHENIGGYGVVGILNPNKKGKKIAWRSDMDAIAAMDVADPSFRSVNEGVSHNCGHDVHTTIGLGLANVLSQVKEEIQGTVYFIFQPSEETFNGAQSMLDDGLLNLIQPDELYGLHVFPTQVGTIQSKSNELFAYQQTVNINFEKSVKNEEVEGFLNKMMQSSLRPNDADRHISLDNLTSAKNGLQNKSTIFKDYFFSTPINQISSSGPTISYQLTAYETDEERMEIWINELSKKIENSKFDEHFIDIKSISKNPTVKNDSLLTREAMKYLKDTFGNEKVDLIYGQIPYFNEDFIYFQKKIPGTLFLLGASNEEKNIDAMPHSPQFSIDEQTINYGVQYFSNLLINRANSVGSNY